MALTPEQLNNSAALEKVWAKAQQLIKYEQMHDAWDLINEIDAPSQRLADSSPEIYKQYQKMLAQLKLIAIPFLIDEQIMELIQKQFLDAFKDGVVDVEKRLRVSLVSKSLFERDQFRKDIIFSLKKNQQRIGDKTIGQWLLNYDEIAGAKKNTSLERSKFMAQSLETNKLPEESKQCLLRLLEFYDNIKITIPITFINISEITLKEFLGELGIPLPEEKKVRPIPKIAGLRPVALRTKKPTTHEKLPTEKEKASLRLVGRRPKISSVYKGKISPYERKRELTPDITPSFAPKEATVSKPQPAPKVVPEKKELPAKVPTDAGTTKVGAEAMGEYQIRTMKKDIARLDPARQEKAKRQPIPLKPEPKVRDNIVDLSGK